MRPTTLPARIIETLTKCPMTMSQVAEELGVHYDAVKYRVRQLHGNGIYVHSWKRTEGHRGRESAVWAIGTKKDAPKPVFDNATCVKRYQAKMRGAMRMRDQARHGRINPFAQLMWGAK
jgi:predicted ArsR family transcriptional regulator